MESVLSNLPVRLVLVLSCVGLFFGAPPYVSVTAVGEEAAIDITDDATPDRFVSNLLEELREISSEENADRQEEVRNVLLRSMAVSRMRAFLVRGDIEDGATAEQVAEYDALFADYISAAIGNSIDRMVDRRIDVGEPRENKRRRGDYIVPAKVFSDVGEERATLGWRVRERGGRFLMTDFTIDGQSFSVERKAQFSIMVRNEGFGALLDHMREVIAE